MRTPSWLVVVPLFVVVWLMALVGSGWPGAVAHATDGPRTRDAGHAVTLSQDNDDESDDDNDEDESDDNDNRDDVNVVPVPVPASAPAPPPAGPSVSAVDEVSQCLANGGMLVYQGPEGGIIAQSYQDNLNVTLTRVDPASQPPPPGVILSSYIFRMSAAPCGGAPYTVLPSEVNLAVSYSEELAAGRDETRLTLMYFDGMTWTVASKLYRDPDNNHVSASVTGLGVYALVQQ